MSIIAPFLLVVERLLYAVVREVGHVDVVVCINSNAERGIQEGAMRERRVSCSCWSENMSE